MQCIERYWPCEVVGCPHRGSPSCRPPPPKYLSSIGARFFFPGSNISQFWISTIWLGHVANNLLSWFQCLFTSSESANEIDLERGLDDRQISDTWYFLSLLKYCLLVLYAHLFCYHWKIYYFELTSFIWIPPSSSPSTVCPPSHRGACGKKIIK